jgi:hypothetical protein
VPTSPQVVYVPTYNPTVVYGAWPYPAYPPVYVPPPPGYAIATGFATGLAFGAGVAVANSLWGGFNWNTHDVNINVNRYNNVNVNNRINANSTTANWNRNESINRTNLNRNNTKLNTANLNNANLSAQRDAYRGRDASRAQAEQTLQNRTGQNLGGTANQRLQDIRSGGTNRSDLRNNAQNVNRDNALRGSGDGRTSRQDLQRGQASRESFANNSGGRLGAGGGGQQGNAGRLGADGAGQRGERGGFQGGGAQRGGFEGGGRAGGFGGGGGGGGRHFGRGR